jgi:diguanylate cyclase
MYRPYAARIMTVRPDPLLAALAAIGVLAALGFGLGRAGLTAQVAIFWLVMGTVHLFFAVSAWRVAELGGRPDAGAAERRGTRRLWRLFAFTGVTLLLGDVGEFVAALRNPFSAVSIMGSRSTVALVAVGIVAIVIGMLAYPTGATGPDKARLRLDVLTVMAGASTFGVWVIALPTGAVGVRWALTLAVTILVQPGVFLVAIFAVVRLVLGGRPPFTRSAGVVLGVSAVLQAGLQVAPVSVYASPQWAPWLMGGNVLGSTLFAFAIRTQECQVRANPQGGQRSAERPYSLLPYGAMAATWVLLVGVLAGHGLDWRGWLVVAGAMATTGLVITRQMTAFRHIGELLRERDALAARLTQLAFHDGLTGLANRALFMTRLSEALAAGPATVFLIDLDDFKPVNDKFGHATGDQLLIEVGRRLRGSVRGEDTVGRLGGDEFAVLVTDLAGDRSAALAASLAVALDGMVRIGPADVPLHGSIGMATGRAGTHDADGLLHEADMAMYAKKGRGGNRRRASDGGIVSLSGNRAGAL